MIKAVCRGRPVMSSVTTFEDVCRLRFMLEYIKHHESIAKRASFYHIQFMHRAR